METGGYSDALHQLIRVLVEEVVDDAVGIAFWKKKRSDSTPPTVYGDGEFPSDSGSPLSTFSSTPNTSPSRSEVESPKTPSFVDLEGECETDAEIENDACTNSNANTDKDLVKYLIGEISESEDENNKESKESVMNSNSELIQSKETGESNTDSNLATASNKENSHTASESGDLHEIDKHEENNINRKPITPIDANVIVTVTS